METTTGSSPSASSSSSTVVEDSKATENRLYQASLILEWQLYDDLLGRHRLAMARLQDLTNEAAALYEENALLHAANQDLKRRIISRLLAATRSNNHSAFPPISSPIGFLPGDRIREEIRDSSMRTKKSGDRRRNAMRSSLPKSISVLSTGFMKIDDRNNHQHSIDIPPSMMENNFITMNRTIQKEEEEVKLTSIEVDAYYQGALKTEICNKWQETGACLYREQCQFAHGISELRPVLRHPRYKTEVCRMVLAGVRCPYGHRCHFRHSFPRAQGWTYKEERNT